MESATLACSSESVAQGSHAASIDRQSREHIAHCGARTTRYRDNIDRLSELTEGVALKALCCRLHSMRRRAKLRAEATFGIICGVRPLRPHRPTGSRWREKSRTTATGDTQWK